jgi:hypothetical protein
VDKFQLLFLSVRVGEVAVVDCGINDHTKHNPTPTPKPPTPCLISPPASSPPHPTPSAPSANPSTAPAPPSKSAHTPTNSSPPRASSPSTASLPPFPPRRFRRPLGLGHRRRFHRQRIERLVRRHREAFVTDNKAELSNHVNSR